MNYGLLISNDVEALDLLSRVSNNVFPEHDFSSTLKFNSAISAIRLNRKISIILYFIKNIHSNDVSNITKLKHFCNDTKIVCISDCEDKTVLKNLFNQGIDGYILANEPEVNLTKLISVLTFDAAPISSKVIKILTKNQENFCPANVKLTNRESDVYELLSKGLPNKSIASQLGLSIFTVADYVKSIFKKMKIHNRSELIILRHNIN